MQCRLLQPLPELKVFYSYMLKFMVISVNRNLKGVKYPHGYKAKEHIWVRSQLFKGEEVRRVRIIQGKQDCTGICKMQGL